MSRRIETLKANFKELIAYFSSNEVNEFDELFEEFEELIVWADKLNTAINEHNWETF